MFDGSTRQASWSDERASARRSRNLGTVNARSARENPWLRSYPTGVPTSLEYPDVPIQYLLETAARDWGDRTALICCQGSSTYSELLSRSRQFAHALGSLGVTRGHRVGILLPNVQEYVIAAFGAWMAGASIVQFSPLLVAEEIEHLVQMTGCNVLVTLDMLSAPLRGLVGKSPLRKLIVTTLMPSLGPLDRWFYCLELMRRRMWLGMPRGEDVIDFADLISRQPTTAPRTRIVPARDAAVIQPTGGTTGTPKAVVLTHRNLLANTLQLKAWIDIAPGQDSVLAVLPFFHCYGLTAVMLGAVALADTMILCPRFRPESVMKLIHRHHPTMLPGVPALYAALNQHLARRPMDLSSIALCVSGASPLDPSVRSEFESYGATNLVEAYGLSEASPATHVNPIRSGARPGTIGVPLPDTFARIENVETGREVSPGESGELVVQGPQVMAGYLDDEAETGRVVRDGWLHTGDIATCDAEGYFRIVDRKKDLIKTSGYNVFPAEVESVLRRHRGVSDAAVVGVPDRDDGELVKAFVVPKSGEQTTVKSLQEFCQEHLAKHKRPRLFELRNDLPRNYLGKVLRRELRMSNSLATCQLS